MSSRHRSALRIWRARGVRSGSDRAFLAYLVVMTALVAVVPVGRAIWLALRSASGLALLTSTAASGVVAAVTAALWVLALVVGRTRGPALLPPFLTHTLGSSASERHTVFGAPVARAGIAVTITTTASAGFVGTSLIGHGADAVAAASLTAAGALTGVIATILWLIGQAFPRTVAPSTALALSVAAVATLAPTLHPFTPWGWVALAYPTSGTPAFWPLVALLVLASALLTVTPFLMNALRLPALLSQAHRWEAATAHATAMDFAAASALYRAVPHRGRRIRAARPRNTLAVTFLIRGAVGAIRMPGRLTVGVLALLGSGVLIALAPTASSPWLPGIAAGVLALIGLGPLTDGVRHAADVTSDLPLYGVSDARLLLLHCLLPAVALVLPCAAGAVTAVTLGAGVFTAGAGGLGAGVLALLVRVGTSLKNGLPPALLTPMPTAFGDAAAGIRLVWALDGPLVAALGGVAAAFLGVTPIPCVIVAAVASATIVMRWRERR